MRSGQVELHASIENDGEVLFDCFVEWVLSD
jgi:hypothetical protein